LLYKTTPISFIQAKRRQPCFRAKLLIFPEKKKYFFILNPNKTKTASRFSLHNHLKALQIYKNLPIFLGGVGR
jgi:hypothetical protein